MKKKLLAFVLSITLLAGMTAGVAAGESDFVIENGILMEYRGPGGNVIIPNGVTGFVAYSEDQNGDIQTAFTKAENQGVEITSITVPGSVKTVPRFAFFNLPTLTRVVLMDGVKQLGDGFATGCSALATVYIPASVDEISGLAFQDMGISQDEVGGPTNPELILCGPAGSYAQEFARELRMTFAPLPSPEMPLNLAYQRPQSVNVNGENAFFDMYALRDAAGNESNYIYVRQLAEQLSGTTAQFNVSWNGAVNLVAGAAYEPPADNQFVEFFGTQVYAWNTAPINVNGVPTALNAIVLTDAEGKGYTYYKLRDLGEVLGFAVDWSAEKGVYLETPGYSTGDDLAGGGPG